MPVYPLRSNSWAWVNQMVFYTTCKPGPSLHDPFLLEQVPFADDIQVVFKQLPLPSSVKSSAET